MHMHLISTGLGKNEDICTYLPLSTRIYICTYMYTYTYIYAHMEKWRGGGRGRDNINDKINGIKY